MTRQGLVLSAGATKGFAMLGALAFLQEKSNCKKFDILVGSSIGALICALLAINLTAIEIFALACSEDWGSEFSLHHLSVQDLLSSHQGLFSFCNLSKRLSELFVQRIGCCPTLANLFLISDVHLVLVTYNLTRRTTEYLSHETYPNLSILDAIKMSCSLPIVFHRCEINKQVFLDGAITDGYAVRYAIDRFSRTNIIAIATKLEKPAIHFDLQSKSSSDSLELPQSSNLLLKYLKRLEIKSVELRRSFASLLDLVAQLIETKQSVDIASVEQIRSQYLTYIHVPLNSDNFVARRFDLNTREKIVLYLTGYSYCRSKRLNSMKLKMD